MRVYSCDEERYERRHRRAEAECDECGKRFLVEVLAGSGIPDCDSDACPDCGSESWELTE